MTGLCQSLCARKIRVTQLHTVPRASPKKKNVFITGSILGGLKPTSLRYTVRATLGTYPHHPPLSVCISFAFRPVQRKTKLTYIQLMSPATLNVNNYISFYWYSLPERKDLCLVAEC